MALPNSNISTTLVGQTLSTSSRDVGTLCVHPNINKWSRWKPVRSNKVVGLVENDLISANGGMQLVPIYSASDLVSFYRANINYDFVYNRPRGSGVTPIEPYRLGDFRNYYHGARRFYSTVKIQDTVAYPTPSILVRLNPTDDEVFPNNVLNWEYLGFADAFFGALIVPSTATLPHRISLSETPFGSGNPYIEMPLSIVGASLGMTYNVYAFIATKEPDSESINAYYPIPDGILGTFLYSQGIVINLNAMLSIDPWEVVWDLEIYNQASTSVTLQNCSIIIRYADNEPDDPIEPTEYTENLGNISVGAKNRVSRNGDAFAVPDIISRGGYILFRSENPVNQYRTELEY